MYEFDVLVYNHAHVHTWQHFTSNLPQHHSVSSETKYTSAFSYTRHLYNYEVILLIFLLSPLYLPMFGIEVIQK